MSGSPGFATGPEGTLLHQRRSRRRRVEGLDVVRGLAIALVLLRHALPAPFAGAGVVGVVMFFALSGHLITGLLLEEVERTGRVDLRAFYRRRAIRLIPALLAMLAGLAAVTLLLDPLGGDRHRLPTTMLAALTWTANLPLLPVSPAAFHLWTLATEEQFYLVWPLVIAAAAGRRRVGLALVLAAAGCLAGCVATLVWLWEDPDLAYALPTSWAVCFVIGAASRVYRDRLRVPARLVPAALLGLAVLSVVPLRGHPLTYLAGGPAIAVLTAVLLLAWRRWTVVAGPARLLVWLGGVSYAAYLWNYPLTLWLRPWGPAGALLAVVLTLLVAELSRRYVEDPMRRWAQRSRTGAVAA